MGSKNIVKLSELTHFFEKQQYASEMAEKYKYLLYGGAAGPGKSYWLRWYSIVRLLKWFKQTKIEGIRAGLFCEDYPSLKDRHISKMAFEFPKWLGEVRDSKEDGLAFHIRPEYGNGRLALRNLDDPSKYLSSEFALVAVDELTKNKETVFNMLRMRLRWPGIDDVQFIAGTNPGEIGHGWVKKLWIDKIYDPNEKEKDKFFYIKALVDDNPHNSQSYRDQLDSLPEKLRKAYRDGDWNVFVGQYFSEFEEHIHVCDPFEIPKNWQLWMCMDYGYGKPSAVYWNATDPSTGKVYTYRELYVTEHTYEMLAEAICRLTPYEEKARIDWFVPDSSIADNGKETGRTGDELMQDVFRKHEWDLSLRLATKGPKSRVNGWNLMRGYLRVIYDENGNAKTRWQIFRTCVNLIRTMPLQVYDKTNPEDLDSDVEDHAPDAMRYGFRALNEAWDKVPRVPVKRLTKTLTNEELFYKMENEV